MAKDKMDTQHVLVFARVRPFSNAELETRAKNYIEINGREITVKLNHGTKRFNFDQVFGMTSTQLDVYETIVSPMIDEVMQGYNCTVFAYGQTGTGKTYTMIGNPGPPGVNNANDLDIGIIPRTLDNLFGHLSRNAEVDFTVRVSYLELYNEILIDLLSSDDKVLKIYEDQKSKGSVCVHGLEEVTVDNKCQILEILHKGSEKRRTAATLLNAQSSRSHTVFTITLHSRESTPEGEDLVKTGKLNLVDLAGSENITKSGSIDKRAREAGSINQSLLTLGRVIKALVEKSAHVPYRESKLTRILQDSLGGKTKTAIIATLSPVSNNLEETVSTLDYAFRARNITNRPEINQRTSKKALINKYLEEINYLKKDLLAARHEHGVYMDPDNYDMMLKESEKQKESLLQAVKECSVFEFRVKELERVQDELQNVYSVTMCELSDAIQSFEKSKDNLNTLCNERRIQQGLIDKYDEAQTAHHEHSKILSEALDKYIKDQEMFTSKVNNLYGIMDGNERTSLEFLGTYDEKHASVIQHFMSAMGKINAGSADIKVNICSAAKVTENLLTSYNASLDHCQCMVDRLNKTYKDNMHKVFSICINSDDRDSQHVMELMDDVHSTIQTTTNSLEYEIANIHDTIAVYKIRMTDEKEELKAKFSRLENKVAKNMNGAISFFRIVSKQFKDFSEVTAAESVELTESANMINNQYVLVETAITENLDTLLETITTQIANLKEQIKNEYRGAVSETIEQHQTVLNYGINTYNTYLSDVGGKLKDIEAMCLGTKTLVTREIGKTNTSLNEKLVDDETSLHEISTIVNNVDNICKSNTVAEKVSNMRYECNKLKYVRGEDLKDARIKHLALDQEIASDDSIYFKQIEADLIEARLTVDRIHTENILTIEEFDSVIVNQSADQGLKVRELANLVHQFVNTLVFPKRLGDTPEGKHSVMSVIPKRVSKNILFQVSEGNGLNDIEELPQDEDTL